MKVVFNKISSSYINNHQLSLHYKYREAKNEK